MIADDGTMDDGARAYEHAAGRVWDAMRDLMTAFSLTGECPPEAIPQLAQVPDWAHLSSCSSARFVRLMVTPFSKEATRAALLLSMHDAEVSHSDDDGC